MSLGGVIRQIGVRILLALFLLPAMKFALKLYRVQETLVVLLVIAISLVSILILAVAFVLFQEGIRRAVLWAKAGVVLLAGLSRRHVGPQEPIVHPSLPR